MTERGDLRQMTARVLGQDESEGASSGTFYSGTMSGGNMSGGTMSAGTSPGSTLSAPISGVSGAVNPANAALGGPFAAASAAKGLTDPLSKRDAKPSHYKVICISMYTDDLKRLDRMVEELKSRGLTKANRSALIRYALGEVDLERVPKGL